MIVQEDRQWRDFLVVCIGEHNISLLDSRIFPRLLSNSQIPTFQNRRTFRILNYRSEVDVFRLKWVELIHVQDISSGENEPRGFVNWKLPPVLNDWYMSKLVHKNNQLQKFILCC